MLKLSLSIHHPHQSIWRGYQVRQWVLRLNRSAIRIQSTFRGYRQRRLYALLLEQTVQERIERHFNWHATNIQRWWRGYWSRRQHFDYYKQRKWLRRLQEKGSELDAETSAYFAEERCRSAAEREHLARKLCVLIARKLHHLLRTHQRPGIYSCRPPVVKTEDGKRRTVAEMTSTAQTKVMIYLGLLVMENT